MSSNNRGKKRRPRRQRRGKKSAMPTPVAPTEPGEAPKLKRKLNEKERLACELVQCRAALATSRAGMQEGVKIRFAQAQKIAELELSLLGNQIGNSNAENKKLADQYDLPDEFSYRQEEDGSWVMEYPDPGAAPPKAAKPKPKPAPAPEAVDEDDDDYEDDLDEDDLDDDFLEEDEALAEAEAAAQS
jgi:hypothetical protein